MGRYFETFNPPFFLDLSFLHNSISDNPKGFDRDPVSILREINLGLSRLSTRDRSNVRISVQEQTVTISGTVPSMAVLKYIANVADNALGVRLVKNNLQIYRSGAESKEPEMSENKKTAFRQNDKKSAPSHQKKAQSTATAKDAPASDSPS